MNYRFDIQYDGTRYGGWQRQKTTENTIQGKIEEVLSRMTGEPVQIQGAGRTDAGVHALGQVANGHFQTDLNCEEICEYMNHYLPEDIEILRVCQVSDRFHSRLNAKGKTYRYRVLNSAVPHIFDRRYVYVCPEKLDVEEMRRAAALLCGTHDYRAFTSAKRSRKSTVRSVDSIDIERMGDEIWFTFSGNGFLFHMVRILMGTLLEVGSGKRKAGEMTALLENGKREDAGPLVPACGLALMEVRY